MATVPFSAKWLRERMALDHPGDVPIRLGPRITANAQPFITRSRDARFHERVGIVPTSNPTTLVSMNPCSF
jgi:hypothetical protein